MVFVFIHLRVAFHWVCAHSHGVVCMFDEGSMCVCVCVCVCVCMCVYICVCLYICVCVCVCAWRGVCLCVLGLYSSMLEAKCMCVCSCGMVCVYLFAEINDVWQTKLTIPEDTLTFSARSANILHTNTHTHHFVWLYFWGQHCNCKSQIVWLEHVKDYDWNAFWGPLYFRNSFVYCPRTYSYTNTHTHKYRTRTLHTIIVVTINCTWSATIFSETWISLAGYFIESFFVQYCIEIDMQK